MKRFDGDWPTSPEVVTASSTVELRLKHIHWNVVGPAFIGVHQMIDPQVDAVRLMADAVAERIATLGGTPIGTPGFVAGHRWWADYSILRATTMDHLGALDVVYSGVVKDHRQADEELDELNLATQALSDPSLHYSRPGPASSPDDQGGHNALRAVDWRSLARNGGGTSPHEVVATGKQNIGRQQPQSIIKIHRSRRTG